MMRRAVLTLIVTAILFTACGGSQKMATDQIRSQTAQAINPTGKSLILAYKLQQLKCIDNADSRSQAQSCVDGVRKTWEPVWDAWDSLRIADDIVDAWCKFQSTKPPGVTLPIIEDLKCEGK